MIKTATKILLLAIATSFSFLLFSPPPKSFYHSLFISTALSDNVSASQHLCTLTRRPHVAGSEANAESAAYVVSVLTSCKTKSSCLSIISPMLLSSSAKDLKDKVSGMGISLIPLFKSIEELAKAATKIDNEKKVSNVI
ncbi:hypothetical protein Pint_13289 [Pistacia integerrima]|uniref:Uncharacterized protein n=1 Tax=Pistacia integerrima TaxID=434235 RepID=A0ACC0Y4W1_9ROSI|nr:hypothetical protein Pint_13289 [Pistacia integerrima]